MYISGLCISVHTWIILTWLTNIFEVLLKTSNVPCQFLVIWRYLSALLSNNLWTHINVLLLCGWPVSGHEGSNSAIQAGKMKLSCLLRTTCCVPQEKFPKSHIINPLLTKLVQSRWLDIGLVLFFWEFMDLNSVSVHKHAKKNLANIQPSIPYTWPITRLYTIKSSHTD